MATENKIVTDEWTLLSEGMCTVTLQSKPVILYTNEIDSDEGSRYMMPEEFHQWGQDELKPFWMKTARNENVIVNVQHMEA